MGSEKEPIVTAAWDLVVIEDSCLQAIAEPIVSHIAGVGAWFRERRQLILLLVRKPTRDEALSGRRKSSQPVIGALHVKCR